MSKPKPLTPMQVAYLGRDPRLCGKPKWSLRLIATIDALREEIEGWRLSAAICAEHRNKDGECGWIARAIRAEATVKRLEKKHV